MPDKDIFFDSHFLDVKINYRNIKTTEKKMLQH